MDRKSRTSRSATLDDTNEEVNLWKQICNALAKLEGLQKETTTVITSINNIHSTVHFEEGISSSLAHRLMEYYKGGMELSVNEAKIIRDIIEKVSVLIALRDASEYNNVIDQKRKKRKAEMDDHLQLSKKSKLMTSGKGLSNINTNNINPLVISPGTQVAAKQPKQKDKNEEWIQAIVISYHNDKNKYQVEDAELDEFGQRPRYMLQPRNVIPIPNTDETKRLTEFSPGQDVLALYPTTTCFYRAKVIATPSKNKESTNPGQYKVQFEDDNNKYQYVLPKNVLELPKAK
ncbi:SGF29 tudor-like domain-containing protein [Pilobolus umbonatus]|nr:SGF29 tudor-like domain-containing protein [Pilobolus umbonatus]